MLLADAPATWADQPTLSTLEALLLFAGIPLLATVTIALLVSAPSLAKGPRYRPSEEWQAHNEWFGAPAELEDSDADAVGRRQLGQPGTSSETGGASARW